MKGGWKVNVFTINNQRVVAEKIDEVNLALAKKFDPSAEVGDYAITLPDRTIGIVSGVVFEQLTGQKTE